MKQLIVLSLVLAVVADNCQSAVIEPNIQKFMNKVFNYQGGLPIKDDRTGETIKDDSFESFLVNKNDTTQADSEAMCWDLIVERTAVTFALQNRVLDELETDLKDSTMNERLRESIDKLTKKLKKDMADASEALKNESAEEYFDALFDTSEDIIQISSLIRDPKLEEKVFLVLVKAVSRLGRNNSSLIQDFIDQCSVASKSPRPRGLSAF